MAARYFSSGVLTTNTTINEATWELIAGAQGVRVFEIGVALNAATASLFGLGRPAAIGVTPTSPVALAAESDNGVAALTKTALAWGTKPTAPSVSYLRRFGLPAEVGRNVVWTFGPSGLYIPAASSVVLFNLAANSALNVWARISE